MHANLILGDLKPLYLVKKKKRIRLPQENTSELNTFEIKFREELDFSQIDQNSSKFPVPSIRFPIGHGKITLLIFLPMYRHVEKLHFPLRHIYACNNYLRDFLVAT